MTNHTERFVELVGPDRDDADIPLDEAALLIAAQANPALDVGHYLLRLDELAARVESRSLAGILDLLYRTEGFRGNGEDYYEAANSYLDRVLDRRLGIPISLGVVLIEVGRRIGVRLVGLNAPGHFLVAHVHPSEPAVVDPFTGAVVTDPPIDVQDLIATRRQILGRMLLNLRQIHGSNGDRPALGWVLRLRAAIPDLPLAERADALTGLGATAGRHAEAADALEQLAQEAPSSDDADKLRAKATQLRARLN